MSKNIIYILSNFPCYSETFILNELIELKRRGYKIVIFSLKRPKERIIQKEAIYFLRDTFYLPFFSFKFLRAKFYFLLIKPKTYLRLFFGIIRYCLKKPLILIKNLFIFPKSVYFAFLMKNKNIQHIHAHFANYPATSAMIVSSLIDIPFSFTCHAHDIFYDATMLDKKIKESKCCIAISEYNRNYILSLYQDLPKEKIKVLHCGVDLEKFSFQKDKRMNSKIKILSIGRLVPTKGFDDLIYACKILKDKNIDFLCQIIGEGQEEKKLKDLAKRLNLENNVLFLGPLNQDEIISYYESADMFILVPKKAKHPDVQDGIPLVLMEAMAKGVPVISTGVSGIPELIEDEIHGFLVKPKEPNELAERILFLKRSPHIKEIIINNAYNKIKNNFNIKNIIYELERIFD